MGYEIHRFQGEVDEELVCPICCGVLENPVQVHCEHAFCKACISEWISKHPTCPLDRMLIPAKFRPVPRITRNLLSRLNISCNFASHGCTAILKIDALPSHLEVCDHNPKRPLPCNLGCGLIIPKDEIKDHNCVKELRALVTKYQENMSYFQQELTDHRFQLVQQKHELTLLKEYVNALKACNPVVRGVAEKMDRHEMIRWSSGLPRAKVLHWGGMISTPDSLLQELIKRALSKSGCPPHVVNSLMENCHEERWPAGLNSLETRQINRQNYENYVCRRVPGKQAVVVLHCDNNHMNDDMILEPGLVMIFAHGWLGETHISRHIEHALR